MWEREDMMFRPVLRGLIKAESLIDASTGVDLDYICLLNEALDVEQENIARRDRYHANKPPARR